MESAISQAISTTTISITEVVGNSLAIVGAFFGSLGALGILISLIKKNVGRRA